MNDSKWKSGAALFYVVNHTVTVMNRVVAQVPRGGVVQAHVSSLGLGRKRGIDFDNIIDLLYIVRKVNETEKIYIKI